MSNYSYAEMQNMQRRAMERVQVMRKKSEDVLETAKYDLERTPKKEEFSKYDTPTAVKPKVTNMPPNFPEDKKYPTFKEYFNEEKNVRQNDNRQQHSSTQSVSSLADSLLSEPDKAILMGLIMLLKSEGADELLIMALMYIMS